MEFTNLINTIKKFLVFELINYKIKKLNYIVVFCSYIDSCITKLFP